MEWQTWTSQKRLPERACGFESRSRHTTHLRSGGCRTVGGRHDNELRVSPAYGRIRITPVEPGRDRPGECAGLRRLYPHDPALALWHPAERGHRGGTLPAMRRQRAAMGAYAYLLGLYLGDGHISHGRRDVYALNVKCSNAWPGLIEAARSAMAAVMPTSSVFCVARPGCAEVKSWSKHWPCLFPQHGPGRKHTRMIALVPWQQTFVAANPGSFVRGLFHSDGCRVINRVRRKVAGEDCWYEYPRYFLPMNQPTSSGCAAKPWTSSASLAIGPPQQSGRVAAERRWRGWMSLSGPSTRAGSRGRGGGGPAGRRSGRGRLRRRRCRAGAWPWSRPAGWWRTGRWP